MTRRGAIWLALCSACYAPSPQPGAPCPDGVCPSGLFCSPITSTCERSAGGEDGGALADATPKDGASADGTGVTTDAQSCYGAGLVEICPSAPITATLTITQNTTIDTDTDPGCISYTGTAPNAYCVLAATSVSIAPNRRLRANGSRPLVVLSTGMFTIDGTIDVTSGAGANPSACVAPTAATGTQGGAGGSFKGQGGAGAGASSGLGPTAAAPTDTVAFRGGCAGGNGAGSTPGTGGSGGGALYLIAPSITINGTINASGGGGGGADVRGGGGGGGAGGFIGLDSSTITVATGARIFANGGGGGEGATQLQNGTSGVTPGSPTTPASGGSGAAPHGGNGGDGSAGTTLTGSNGQPGGGCGRGSQSGGGGGGGAGIIYVFPAQTVGGSVSPPPVS